MGSTIPPAIGCHGLWAGISSSFKSDAVANLTALGTQRGNLIPVG